MPSPIPACLAFIAAGAIGLAAVGCGGTTVNRTDPNAVRDLSGNWNATDSNEVAEKMITEVMARLWHEEFTKTYGRKPVVKIGRVIPRTQDGEFIDTRVFTADIERVFINSGKVRAVADRDEVGQAREERQDQAANASVDTRKEDRQELGGDFLLIGDIRTQNDQEGREKQKAYFINLVLTDIKTQEKVWLGNHRISKDVNRDKYK